MDQRVIILGTDENQCNLISGLLKENGYKPQVRNNFTILEKKLPRHEFSAVILDLDSVSTDNHMFRCFKRNNPDIVLLAVSARSFHPDLKESMEKHIFACMLKPVDPDEILFLLKSGCDKEITT